MLGVIADDFTGAADIAGVLVAAGFKTTICIGVPPQERENFSQTCAADALIVALKTRTAPLSQALGQTRQAWDFLRHQGATQYYFKYCSTFDSTPKGNIGPVLDLMADLTGAKKVPVVPSYPVNRRNVFRGYLFVGDVLLSESPMRHHPLTPMDDANLVRFLAQQTRRGVGLVAIENVHQGAAAIEKAMDELGNHIQHVVMDAIEEGDLAHIAAACTNLPFLSGGAALVGHFSGPHKGRARTLCQKKAAPQVMLVGSASDATREQLRMAAQTGISCFKLDIATLLQDPALYSGEVFSWIRQQWSHAGQEIPLIIHSAEFIDERSIRKEREEGYGAADAVEKSFAALARHLFDAGQRDFVVAGGETSGTIVEALQVSHIEIGQDIAPGVVWTCGYTHDGQTLNLALKSGNFGGRNFFCDAKIS